MNLKLLWAIIVVAVVGAMILMGFLNKKNNINIMSEENSNATTTVDAYGINPVAVFETNQGNFEIELQLDKMPITASNFVKLAKAGFYDGTRFHRVIKDFMIQGGDPLTKSQPENVAIHGTGGPGYAIEDEFVAGQSNGRGTISMANSGPNSGGSQFFINLVDNTFLDFDNPISQGKHPVFGKVVSGMDVVDKIGLLPTVPGDRPVEAVIVNKVTIR